MRVYCLTTATTIYSEMTEKQTEWMYNGSSKPDPESYLLGRRIDDAVDPTQETTKDWLSGKVPEEGDIGARAEMWKTKDAFAKAREDPMFIIEKQKRSAHVDFKNNPLKVQKIKDLLANELKKDMKKKKKKKRKKSDDDDEQDAKSTSRQRKGSDSRRRSSERKRSRSRDRRAPSPTKPRATTSAASTRPGRAPPPSQKFQRGGSGVSKKMTAEELEKKRAEMLENASSRDSERREKYKKRKANEVNDTSENKEGKAEFLQKFKVDSYASGSSSVEDRIKSGIFSKQRTKADLNNFLKK